MHCSLTCPELTPVPQTLLPELEADTRAFLLVLGSDKPSGLSEARDLHLLPPQSQFNYRTHQR